MTNEDRGHSIALALLAAMIPMLIYQTWAVGFVAARLWQWFVVADLHVRPVGWKAWSALYMTFSMFRYRTRTRAEKRDGSSAGEASADVIMWLIFPWVALAIGAVLK